MGKRRRNEGRKFSVRFKPLKKNKNNSNKKKILPTILPSSKNFEWNTRRKLNGDYTNTGVTQDPNQLLATNPANSIKTEASDPEHRALHGLPNLTDKKHPPRRLNLRQYEVMEKLIGKYGEDVKRMLEKQMESFHYWGQKTSGRNWSNSRRLKWYNDPLQPQHRYFIDRCL